MPDCDQLCIVAKSEQVVFPASRLLFKCIALEGMARTSAPEFSQHNLDDSSGRGMGTHLLPGYLQALNISTRKIAHHVFELGPINPRPDFGLRVPEGPYQRGHLESRLRIGSLENVEVVVWPKDGIIGHPFAARAQGLCRLRIPRLSPIAGVGRLL